MAEVTSATHIRSAGGTADRGRRRRPSAAGSARSRRAWTCRYREAMPPTSPRLRWIPVALAFGVLALPAPAQAATCSKRGTASADRLTGGWLADRICALGGNDLLSGGVGNDRLNGGSGNDRLRGGSGNDRLIGGVGDDELGLGTDFGAERGDDVLDGGPGNDVLNAGQGDDAADGGDGDDVLRMAFGDDHLGLGGAGNDRIDGGNGNDGTRSDELGGLFGGPGADIVTGDGGDDRLFGDGRPDGPAGDDIVYGGGGGDEIDGGPGNDLLLGGKGGDRMDAGPGHDVLVGGSGADTLLGGPGDDLLWATDFERNSTDVLDPAFFTAPGDNAIDCGEGNDMAIIDLADDRALIIGCEYVVVLRSGGSSCSPVSRWLGGGLVKSSLLDIARYPPNSNGVLATASLFPEKPAWSTDEEAMRSCSDYAARYLTDPTDDRRPNVRGTDGADILVAVPAGQAANPRTLMPAGSPDGASVFNAGAGDDVVAGSPGADTVLGGDGDDSIRGGDGADVSLEGENGDDLIWSGPGDDVLFGRTGDDRLWGEDGDDYVEGGRGDDALSGGGGADRLFGGHGQDRLRGGGDDELVAYDGSADVVDCGAGDDVAYVDRRDRVIGCERVIAPRSARKTKRRI